MVTSGCGGAAGSDDDATAAAFVADRVAAEIRRDPALGPAGLPPPYVTCHRAGGPRSYSCAVKVDASRLYDPPFSELTEMWRVELEPSGKRVLRARRLKSEIGRRRTS
jgi:hypothetical protein